MNTCSNPSDVMRTSIRTHQSEYTRKVDAHWPGTVKVPYHLRGKDLALSILIKTGKKVYPITVHYEAEPTINDMGWEHSDKNLPQHEL